MDFKMKAANESTRVNIEYAYIRVTYYMRVVHNIYVYIRKKKPNIVGARATQKRNENKSS